MDRLNRQRILLTIFILLLSALIFNTVGCQLCDRIEKLEDTVKEGHKKAEKADKKIKELQQQIDKDRIEKEEWEKLIMKVIFIIVFVLIAYYGLKHLWIHRHRNRDK